MSQGSGHAWDAGERADDKETTTTMTHTEMIAIAEHKIHARQVVEVTS